MSTIDLPALLADDAVVEALAERLAPAIAQRSIKIQTCWGDWSRVHIGSRVQLVNALFNTSSGHIWIGDDTFFGHNVCVLTGTHDVTKTGMERTQHPTEGRDIGIGQGVWIASNATILGPCTIGDYAVVCAGSVVVGDVKPGWLYAGIPAKPIRPCFGAHPPDKLTASSTAKASAQRCQSAYGGLTLKAVENSLDTTIPNNANCVDPTDMSTTNSKSELVKNGPTAQQNKGEEDQPESGAAGLHSAPTTAQSKEPQAKQTVDNSSTIIEQHSNDVSEIERLKGRMTQFLGQLVGGDKAGEMLNKMLDPNEQLQLLARSIAKTTPFERLFKQVRTLNIQQSSSKESDPAYVGLTNFDCKAPFAENFRTHFAPLLANRADGFNAIFGALMDQERKPLIIETGCLRVAGNWAGDGQSTFLFDTYAQQRGGWAFSIDINLESIETARRACSHITQFILNDSVAALNALSSTLPTTASLLYLDSFDLDINNPTPSAIHHILELLAARPLLGPGTVVVVDDFGIADRGGKGMIVNDFFSRSSAEVLYNGYQKVWRMR